MVTMYSYVPKVVQNNWKLSGIFKIINDGCVAIFLKIDTFIPSARDIYSDRKETTENNFRKYLEQMRFTSLLPPNKK